ncbi:MAG: TetR/AcrR family transcriptional regulator [Actinomycetaceae bacterium]|nr:TetR/AcrR family transcriptional regulator [Actinomycetaceae bacterium]
MGSRFETQDKLIAATRHIIIHEGIEGFTLDNVCTRAGFSRGAFYSNFATKDSLLATLAEDEYAGLIERLNLKVQQWQDRGKRESRDHAVIEDLLFEALDAIGVNRSLFILHSEMLTRSARDADWGARLLDLNDEFVRALSAVLEAILHAAGRTPTRDLRALTHTVIGIVLRAASVDALRTTAKLRAQNDASRVVGPATIKTNSQEIPDSTSVAKSPARDIVEMILLLLYAASEPLQP